MNSQKNVSLAWRVESSLPGNGAIAGTGMGSNGVSVMKFLQLLVILEIVWDTTDLQESSWTMRMRLIA